MEVSKFGQIFQRKNPYIEIEHGFDHSAQGLRIAAWKWRNSSVPNIRIISQWVVVCKEERNLPYENTQLAVSFGLVERGLQCTKFVDEASQRPNIGLGIVCFLLHQFWGHIVGCL